MFLNEAYTKILDDDIFGKMQYEDNKYYKHEKINFFKRNILIKVSVRTYGKDINDIQRKAYTDFKKNIKSFESDIQRELLNYYKKFVDSSMTDANSIIAQCTPYELIFNTNGDYGYICNVKWDEENGIAIKLNGKIIIDDVELLL